MREETWGNIDRLPLNLTFFITL
uniref:Uncharacterized protein n=1 Tax=Anguilla anguilla TaxID=7936 RepID=A0A0E9UZG6_ANGAN